MHQSCQVPGKLGRGTPQFQLLINVRFKAEPVDAVQRLAKEALVILPFMLQGNF